MRLSPIHNRSLLRSVVCSQKNEASTSGVTWGTPTLHRLSYAPLLLMDESFRLSNHSPPYCGQIVMSKQFRILP